MKQPAQRICRFEGCDLPRHARGWCSFHYKRWYHTGDPATPPTGRRRGPDERRWRPVAERFWPKVDRSDPDGCWPWIGSMRHSYGEIWVKGKRAYAHRVAYELANGTLRADQVVCHSCDNPRCVRPSHLFTGTQADNVRDMIHKGRGDGQFGTPRRSQPRQIICADCGASVLTRGTRQFRCRLCQDQATAARMPVYRQRYREKQREQRRAS